MTKKEKAFCVGYLDTGSIIEAEKYAGLTGKGYSLITRDDINSEIRRLSKMQEKNLGVVAKAGLRRLATDSVSDAVRLVYMDNPDTETLESLNLYMVSEIRRRDSSIEIKFFDRLKALDKLSGSESGISDSVPFYDALIAGAEQLSRQNNNDN